MWIPTLQMAIPEVMVLTDMEKNTSTIAFDIKPQAVESSGNRAGGSNAKKHCTSSDNQYYSTSDRC
jgi:hypothetical protein